MIPVGFNDLSSSIIRLCSFCQGLIQQIIYITHGSELNKTKQTLNSFPSPRARIDFLTSFQYSEADFIVSTVFDYARELFVGIYEIRNVLVHENWMSSDEFEGAILFSKLDEEARLSMASGKLLHEDQTTPEEIYNASIRYIRSVKIVSIADLLSAIKAVNLCAWILMNIGFVLDQSDPTKKAELRRAFLVNKGTSHLFDTDEISSETANVESSKRKKIRR